MKHIRHMIRTYNCIFHIYKGYQNIGISFLYDIITPSGMIFCSDKMLKHFILDLLVKYIVIFWHFMVVTYCELFWNNYQCCDLIYAFKAGECWNNYYVDVYKLVICPDNLIVKILCNHYLLFYWVT